MLRRVSGQAGASGIERMGVEEDATGSSSGFVGRSRRRSSLHDEEG